MTKGRWSALQIHRSVDDVADICARKTPCCPIWTGETLLNWIGGQNQWKNNSKSHDSAGAWKIFHGKYGEQLVPRISVFSCFKNKGGRDNNKPLHGYMYICGKKMVYVDIFISNKWMIINVTYDHSMWGYHSLTFLPNPKPSLPKGNHGVTMWQLYLALSSLTACWFPVPMFQWQKLRANTWHGFQANGKNTSHFGARLNILGPGKHWFYSPENGHGTYKLTLFRNLPNLHF